MVVEEEDFRGDREMENSKSEADEEEEREWVGEEGRV